MYRQMDFKNNFRSTKYFAKITKFCFCIPKLAVTLVVLKIFKCSIKIICEEFRAYKEFAYEF